MQPKVSIVIPVYNVEKYLAECLDSVVNQTMRDIQIICVNDGSPDGSRAILQEYADRDSRIQIIDKPNGGLSSARNAAYPHIRGKYTLFVDSDDWIELDLCEKTYRKAEESGAAMIIFFFQKWKEYKIQLLTSNNQTTVKEKHVFLDFPSACSKLWKTEFLLDNNLFFPEGLFFEDNLINWQAVTLADKIAVLPERLYHHRHNSNSITQTWGEHALHYVPIYNKIRDYLLESGYYAAYREKFIAMKLDVWYRHYRNLPASLRTRFAAMIRESLTTDDREFYRTASKKQCKTVARLFYAMLDGDKTSAWKFRLVHTIKQAIRAPELLLKRLGIKPINRRLKTKRL